MAAVEDIRTARERELRLLAEIGGGRITSLHGEYARLDPDHPGHIPSRMTGDDQAAVRALVRDGLATEQSESIPDPTVPEWDRPYGCPLVLTGKGRAVLGSDRDQVTVTIGRVRRWADEIEQQQILAAEDGESLVAKGIGEAILMLREYLAAVPGQDREL